MQVRKRTYAYLLLVIFAAVTLHDLLPHAHHDHDSATGQADHHQDHHEDHHHDHEHNGLLASMGHLLHFHQHSHSDCKIEICQEIPMVKRDLKDGKDIAPAELSKDQKTAEPSSTKAPETELPISNTDFFLKSISTRGSPSDDC